MFISAIWGQDCCGSGCAAGTRPKPSTQAEFEIGQDSK
jgi:hypothetical protein